jgi:hypothetical protein
MERKTLPEKLAAVLTPAAVQERPIGLIFQDEARFGRMARIRRCWAPAPLRPTVRNGYEREFTYIGAYSGHEESRLVADTSPSTRMTDRRERWSGTGFAAFRPRGRTAGTFLSPGAGPSGYSKRRCDTIFTPSI